MRVRATFRHVFEVTRDVEIDDEDFQRLYTHQHNRDRETSDEYLIPLYLDTQETEYLADVFPDWKMSAPLPSDFELQYTEVTEGERLPEPTDPEPTQQDRSGS